MPLPTRTRLLALFLVALFSIQYVSNFRSSNTATSPLQMKLEDSLEYGIGLTNGAPQQRGQKDIDMEGCISELWAYHPRLSAFRQLSSIPWPEYLKRGEGESKKKKKKIDQETWRLMEGTFYSIRGSSCPFDRFFGL